MILKVRRVIDFCLIIVLFLNISLAFKLQALPLKFEVFRAPRRCPRGMRRVGNICRRVGFW